MESALSSTEERLWDWLAKVDVENLRLAPDPEVRGCFGPSDLRRKELGLNREECVNSDMQIVFQDPALNPRMMWQHHRRADNAHGILTDGQRWEELLEVVGLSSHHAKVSRLSSRAGTQRIGCACHAVGPARRGENRYQLWMCRFRHRLSTCCRT